MPLILGTNSIKDTGYDVANSLRFDDGSSDYLVRSLGSQSSLRVGTFSYWVKRSALGNAVVIFNEVENDNNRGYVHFDSDNAWRMVDNDTSGTHIELKTNRVFRDIAAWYHIVVRVDTTQSTNTDRVRLYVNGVQETSFATTTYPSQNDDLKIFQGGQTNKNTLGAGYPASNYFDGYMAEFVYCDGQSLAPDSFGEFDSDSPTIWKPKDVSGLTFGNNGFYLDFQSSGALGNDVSGNNNDFTATNLTSLDQSTDTCTNNFATLNPLNVPTSNAPTFSEGNLVSITNTSTGSYKWGGCTTIGMTQGKFYCEAKATISGTYSRSVIGITGDSVTLARTNASILDATASCGYYSENGAVAYNGAGSVSGYSTSYTTGDIIGIAFDLDNGKLYFSKNGVFLNSGNPASGSTGTGAVSINAASTTPDGAYFFAQTDDTGTSSPSKFEFNFGSPSFAISSGNADANGYGNFEYSVPSGYYSLNTKNLAEFG